MRRAYITIELFLFSILHTFSLWNVAGQEGFENIRSLAYDNVDILLVSFSIVSPASFENAKEKWYPEIQRHMDKNTQVSGHCTD